MKLVEPGVYFSSLDLLGHWSGCQTIKCLGEEDWTIDMAAMTIYRVRDGDTHVFTMEHDTLSFDAFRL